MGVGQWWWHPYDIQKVLNMRIVRFCLAVCVIYHRLSSHNAIKSKSGCFVLQVGAISDVVREMAL